MQSYLREVKPSNTFYLPDLVPKMLNTNKATKRKKIKPNTQHLDY